MIKLPTKTINKILIVTLSNLGDVILTLPVIGSIRKVFPKAEIHVVVGRKAYDLLQGNPALKKVVIYEKKDSLINKLKFIIALRKEKYDFVLDFRNSMIPYLVGRPSKSLWLNHQLRKIESRYERYEYLLNLIGMPQVSSDVFPLSTKSDSESLIRILHSKGLFNLQNMLIVSPGARFEHKRWPVQHFASLINRIVEKEQMDVILIGDKGDCVVANEVEKLLKTDEVVNICGKDSQKECAFLIERARLVISNDSAIMHLANYFRRPVVAVFGPTSRKKYGATLPTARNMVYAKSCIPCEQVTCPTQRECLTDLMPDDVFPVVMDLLKKKQ